MNDYLRNAKRLTSMATGLLERNFSTDTDRARARVLIQLAIANALVALVEHMEQQQEAEKMKLYYQQVYQSGSRAAADDERPEVER
jgi:hypothetical protein